MGTASSRSRNGCCDDPERHRLLGPESTPAPTDVPDTSVATDIRSVIQFSTQIYYCAEDEGKVKIDIVRMGENHYPASCSYETKDGSAHAGVKYEYQTGVVVFEPGMTMVTIAVPIMQDDRWDSTLDFHLLITQVRGAQLGKYLNVCRVSIIDDDTFPTNRYRDKLRDSRDVEGVSRRKLMLEYCKMNLGDAPVWRRTLLWISLDFVKSFYFFMTLYLQLYLVDVVIMGENKDDVAEGAEGGEPPAERRLDLAIHTGVRIVRLLSRVLSENAGEGDDMEEELFGGKLLVPGSHRETAIVVGMLYMIPFILLQIIDVLKVRLQLDGICRKRLQVNLFRKFLNYKEERRAAISSGDITMAMTRDISEVVDSGFMKILEVIRILGKLGFAVVFILSENKMAAVPLGIFPVVMSCFLICREGLTIQKNEDMAHKQNKLVHAINDCIANFRLIADFHLRPYVVRNVEEYIDEYNSDHTSFWTVMQNNTYLAPWLTTLFVGFWMIIGTFETEPFGGPLSLGTFVATINVFKEIGLELQEIYVELIEIQISLGPLEKLTYFMNLSTDLDVRMRINRARRAAGKERNAAQRRASSSADSVEGHSLHNTPDPAHMFAVDQVAIEFRDMSFQYGEENSLISLLNEDFPQGKFYSFLGPPHQGKATLLKILGGVLVPTEGDVLVPPHLRVVHVAREAFYLNSSLLMNIILNHDISRLGGYERIRNICISCGFSAKMMRMLAEMRPGQTEDPGGSEHQPVRNQWTKALSHSETARFLLARVLVMNPEALVMHMPFIAFNDEEAATIQRLVRQHINERGLELPESERTVRRPRTFFCSSAAITDCVEADFIYTVESGQGLRLMQRKT